MVSLAVTWAWALLLPEPARGYAGSLLVAMLVLIVLFNIAAGRAARRHLSEAAARQSG